MTEINKETLIENGWKRESEKIYMKGDYVIIEQNGKYGIPTYNGKICPGSVMSSIEELEDRAWNHYNERVKFLSTQLKKAEDNLKKFKKWKENM